MGLDSELIVDHDELHLELLGKVRSNTIVVADFGGVLGGYDFSSSNQLLATRSGKTVEQVHAAFQDDDLFCRYGLGRLSTEQYVRTFLDRLALDMSIEEFIQLQLSAYLRPSRTVGVMYAIKTVCKMLCMLSNNNDMHASYLRRTDPHVFAPFDHVWMSHEIGFWKPNPDCYEFVEQQVGCKGNQIVLIDDRIENLEGAAARGWVPVWYSCDTLKGS